MKKTLPARPHLDHLRGRAKTLLAALAKGDAAAVRAFRDHLPPARGRKAARLRLADAQAVVARQNGFGSWPALVRHVEALRALEGEWRFSSLEVDGAALEPTTLAASRILIDGDRFRTESPEGTWEGIFDVDAEAKPRTIDIEFVSGPDAGETCQGIFMLEGDELTLCLGVAGAARPRTFAARAGSGHALERLHRASKARPAGVTGGTPPPPAPAVPRADPAAFHQPMTPLLRSLQGQWSAVEVATDGNPLPAPFLAHGARTMTGNEVTVVFGGQTVVHAKVRIDETAQPIAVDYVDLRAKHEGELTFGILEWIGDDVRFLMAPPGAPRPSGFDEKKGTLSRWRITPAS